MSNSPTPVGAGFIAAAKTSCRAKIEEAQAKIELYLNCAQGVSDHAGIMEEILSAAEQGAHAEDVLNFLEKRW